MNSQALWVNGTRFSTLKGGITEASRLSGRRLSYHVLTQKLRYRETMRIGGVTVSTIKPAERELFRYVPAAPAETGRYVENKRVIMNQDEVKQVLLSLHECAEDFSVVFSGKKSRVVNGLYKYDSRTIIIHNWNFTVDDTLMYTAIHELTHHIMATEYGRRGRRSHTQLFWATFHDLLDKARAELKYTVSLDEETRAVLDEVREISAQIAALQRKLGDLIGKVVDGCEKQGLRAQDFLEREAHLSMQTVRRSVIAANMELPEDIGMDVQAAIASERDPDKRLFMVDAAKAGKSAAQVKRAGAPPPEQPDEAEVLEKEWTRIERTIKSLTRRLLEVEEHLKVLTGAEHDAPIKAASHGVMNFSTA
jgi:hypothetical protein